MLHKNVITRYMANLNEYVFLTPYSKIPHRHRHPGRQLSEYLSANAKVPNNITADSK